ncbi:class II fructose-bisphosphatase [Oceanidesulfovibrio marinus]|uniref:Fructose-1,6-bisphosphatase n=1 Tax=Oceanidesulfovibrio marinus TaxID=370038 RepID=A0A6P1ZMW9_9BACT|nr:class II fructose-bisphosphatase [Oceanidesulfovibrio marinus]QJT11236.1 class II fructose-bisphosphatase [Oceanidesulfovibrio marinus]TVM35279.1 class II fructose-bisphosphatase [Oceanidesulfovibrio marinus]
MEAPDRNLALDLVRVTEAAALASARWLGRGDKNSGDQAAVDAMRVSFDSLHIKGSIVIGEGEKDEAPMLFNGESVGTGEGPMVDVAVDPVEGTRLLAYGRPNAICVVGLAPRGTMYVPPESYYMQKLVLPAEAAEAADLDAPIGETLRKAAKCLGKDVDDLVVFVLDKPRHEDIVKEIRAAGARIQLHTDGDVMGSLMAVDPRSEVDVMIGTGGTPEGVLSACAIRGTGGRMLCRLDPQSDAEKQRLLDAGVDLSEILTEKTLVRDENVFFACTGISSGTFIKGVRYQGRGATTQSLVIRGKTGTVRYIESLHNWDKLMRISAVKYD